MIPIIVLSSWLLIVGMLNYEITPIKKNLINLKQTTISKEIKAPEDK